MDRLAALEQEFLAASPRAGSFLLFLLDLLLSGALAWILGRFYVRRARTFSNRAAFAANFVPLAMTTMLVISVVRSSLALGAGQRVLSITALAVILAALELRPAGSRTTAEANLPLTVAGRAPGRPDWPAILGALREHCRTVELRRLDSSEEALEALVLVRLEGIERLRALEEALRRLDRSLRITFVDAGGIEA